MIRLAIRTLLLVLSVRAAAAQLAGSPPRTATPSLTQHPPVVDGRLDDEMWLTATLLTGFVQRELREGEAVSGRTEVRIASDGVALYIGAWLFDREPAGIVAGEKIRDVAIDNSATPRSFSTHTSIARTDSSRDDAGGNRVRRTSGEGG